MAHLPRVIVLQLIAKIHPYNQLTIGLKGYIPQVSLPSETQVYGITGSINGLYEGNETVQSHLYGYLPLSTVFADIELNSAKRYALEIGAGIQALRFDISTDEVYGAQNSFKPLIVIQA